MSRAAFRAMAIAFVRDRGALLMSIVLPVVFFLVFAAIFAGASGGRLRLEVAVSDEVGSETSRRLVTALGRQRGLTLVPAASRQEVREQVRDGRADAGLVVRADAEALGTLGGFGKPPLLLVVDPTKAAAAQLLRGEVQRTYFSALPDVALGGVARLLDDQFVAFTDAQRRDLAAGLAELRTEAIAGAGGATFEDLFAVEAAVGRQAGEDHVAYYAGAVAIMFLFFSAVHGALSLHDERDSGLIDRVVAGPGGVRPVVIGKLWFLIAQGGLQVTLIFLVAWLVHHVPLPRRFAAFALVTLAAALAAAGCALLLVIACRTRRQAQSLANVLILLGSAVGGSMVPRFLMPEWLQRVGWFTPTTWAVEAYAGLFWRDQPVAALMLPIGLLVVTGVVTAACAVGLGSRWERV